MIYKRIRDFREDKDWTQQYMADLLYVDRRTYYSYENGINDIPTTILIALSKIHETSTDYLLGNTDVKTPYPEPKKAPPVFFDKPSG